MFLQPASGAIRQPPAHPGVMIPGQKGEAGYFSKEFHGFGGPGADADRVPGMESGVIAFAPDIPVQGLQGRQIGVRVGENHYFHIRKREGTCAPSRIGDYLRPRTPLSSASAAIPPPAPGSSAEWRRCRGYPAVSAP